MQRKILSKSEIKFIANKIKEKFNPEKIILFGSYAYGKPDKESDVDLLVIMKTSERYPEVASKIRLYLDDTIGVICPIDILVRNPEEVKKRIKQNDFFLKTIVNEGIEL